MKKESQIEGVIVKELVTHVDERGFFREIIRKSDEIFAESFGQLSHSLVHEGVIKAWHAHKIQSQWNYVLMGVIKVVLYDLRQESSTYSKTMEFLAGDHHPPRVYLFPPGVAHGYQCLHAPMHIIYMTSGTYDLTEEIRFPVDDVNIGYDWRMGKF